LPTAATKPTGQSFSNIPTDSTAFGRDQRVAIESAEQATLSRIRRAASAVMAELGNCARNSEHHAFNGSSQERLNNPVVLADPYGLISRWKVKQEIEAARIKALAAPH